MELAKTTARLRFDRRSHYYRVLRAVEGRNIHLKPGALLTRPEAEWDGISLFVSHNGVENLKWVIQSSQPVLHRISSVITPIGKFEIKPSGLTKIFEYRYSISRLVVS